MKRLSECIKSKKINNSYTREIIYEIIKKRDDCIKVQDIIDEIRNNYSKKISLNTIYRHLNLFVECGLVVVLQDDFKRAYYCIKKDNNIFLSCTNCKRITRINKNINLNIDNMGFITIHKLCPKCLELLKFKGI